MTATRRLCLALDLQDDAELIADYERHPRAVWPEVKAGIRRAGIRDMEIWRVGDRLVMIIEVAEDFDPAAKAEADAADPRIRQWEALMARFQRPLPQARPGEKWAAMTRIFKLD